MFIFVNTVAQNMYLSATEWGLNLKSWNSYAVLKLHEVADLNFKFSWCKIQKMWSTDSPPVSETAWPISHYTRTVTFQSTAGQIFFTVHACDFPHHQSHFRHETRIGRNWRVVIMRFLQQWNEGCDTVLLGEWFTVFFWYVEKHTPNRMHHTIEYRNQLLTRTQLSP